MTHRTLRLAPVVALCAAAVPARAELALPALFDDGMVLPRSTDAPIWGWASPGDRVTVTASWGGAAEAVAGADGRWSLRLAVPAEPGPHGLRIESPGDVRTIDDVLAGEVWLCSGQSNMEWPLGRTDDAGDVTVEPRLRVFAVENALAAWPRADVRGRWEITTPETAPRHSAVAHHFGRVLLEALDVPVGLIVADWGGTRIEAWTSAEALAGFDDCADELARLAAMRDPARRAGASVDRIAAWWSALDDRAPGGRTWIDRGELGDGWGTMALPSTFAGDLASFDGIVYLRRTIDLPDARDGAAAVLELGPIDDQDEAWVNGHPVGATRGDGQWDRPRRYDVPAGVLRAGANVVAVRVLDTGGPGGVNGTPDQLVLRFGVDDVVSLAGPWRFAAGPAVGALPPMPQGPEIGPNVPSALFNAMIAPIIDFGLDGVIWYQGESNRGNAAAYRDRMAAMIDDWRTRNGRPELPFEFVQIAPFRYGGDTGQTARLREAQLEAWRTIPNTAMAVTLDAGNPADIHPRAKRIVGERLAASALADVYGRTRIAAAGPRLRDHVVDGGAVRLMFEFATGGLVLREAVPQPAFFVAGADRRFIAADARIDGGAVVVSSPDVPAPVAVRYAWEPAPPAVLFNGAARPASPFRTDDWDDPLPPRDNGRRVQRWRGDDPGLVPIFDGRTLEGWVNVNGAPSTWRVEDGMIACSGLPTGVLRTTGRYENYILEMEYRHRVAGGNAGLFVWSDPRPALGVPFTRSIEVQVMDGLEGDGYTSDGDLFAIHGATMTPENNRGRSRAFPTERRANAAPLWNHYRVEARDGVLTLAVNGKVVSRGRDARPREGFICLESEGSPVDFRAIRIERLPSTDPAPEDRAAEAEGFRPLYGGVDLEGWDATEAHAGHWQVADWRLRSDGAGPDLRTTDTFGDFELVCDWRWTGEAPDLDDDSMSDDARAVIPPPGGGAAGRWHRVHVTLIGDRVTIVQDGVTVVDDRRRGAAPGPIVLRGLGAPIEFASVLIRKR